MTNHDIGVGLPLLTETWLTEQGDEAQKAEMTPAGYILKSFPRKNRRGGGLAFLMKKSWERHVVIKLLSFSTFEAFEACVVYNSVSVTLICLYRPAYSKQNNITNKMFLDEFPDFLHSLSNRKGEVTVMGDLIFILTTSMTVKCVN